MLRLQNPLQLGLADAAEGKCWQLRLRQEVLSMRAKETSWLRTGLRLTPGVTKNRPVATHPAKPDK